MLKKKKDFYSAIAEYSLGELKEVMSNCSEQARRIGVWPIALAEIAWIALYSPILQLFVGGLKERRAALFWYDDLYGPLTFDQTVQNAHDINFCLKPYRLVAPHCCSHCSFDSCGIACSSRAYTSQLLEKSAG